MEPLKPQRFISPRHKTLSEEYEKLLSDRFTNPDIDRSAEIEVLRKQLEEILVDDVGAAGQHNY